MPTGIEEAGLVLAVIPILITLVETSIHSVRVVKDFAQYKKKLRKIKRVLGAELGIFEDVLYKLFDTAFDDDGHHARQLVADPMATMWSDPALDSAIRRRIGDSRWVTCEGLIDSIQEALSDLLHQFDKASPSFSDGRLRAVRLQAGQIVQRFRVTFSASSAGFDELHRLIELLHGLVKGAKYRSPAVNKTIDPLIFKELNFKARDICVAVDNSLSCRYHLEHVAGLCVRTSAGTDRLDHTAGSADANTFQLVFRAASDQWHSISLSPRALTSSCCSPIDALCKRLACAPPGTGLASGGQLGPCLGFIHCQLYGGSQCFCLQTDPDVVQPQTCTSLYDTLTDPTRGLPPFRYEKIRLKLGIAIAASVLSLFSTPWLPRMCSTRDILFMQSNQILDEASVLRPYLARRLPSVQQGTAAPPMVRNAELYALGKIFIQLIECRPLIDPKSVWPNSNPYFDPEQQSATDLERTICGKAGKTWSEVIRRCLYCDLGMDTSDCRLDNDEFLCKAYALILQPLVDALNAISS